MVKIPGLFPTTAAQYNGIDGSRQSKSCGLIRIPPKGLRVFVILVCLGGLTQEGCSRGGPEAIADQFMESYYTAANLEDALKLADGLAAKKIQEQQLLRRGQMGAQTTQGRRVSYRRTEKHTAEGRLFFRYEIQIDIQGGGAFTRKALLALGEGPDGWRVTNFSDTD